MQTNNKEIRRAAQEAQNRILKKFDWLETGLPWHELATFDLTPRGKTIETTARVIDDKLLTDGETK